MSNDIFAGKNVLVTGAATGIGQATAKAIAAAGARVILVSRNRAALESAAASMAGEVRVEPCDVGDAVAVESLAARIHDDLGPLDILINNAGVAIPGSFLQQEDRRWAQTFQINVMGVVHGIRAFLPKMLEAGGQRHIVNVASTVAKVPLPGMIAYSASKAAVSALGDGLSGELHGSNIIVQTVYPGFVNTPMAHPTGATDVPTAQLDRMSRYFEANGCAPEVIARDIVSGIAKGRAHIFTGPHAGLANWISRLSPGMARRLGRKLSIDVGFIAEPQSSRA